MIEIERRKFKDMDLKGGTIIEGFPGIGVVSSISATYLIDLLKLDQICALDSEEFPPTSMIYAYKPKFPARIYASEDPKIGVFISEFTPPPHIHRPIAKKLLEWANEKGCKRIVCTEGLPSPKKDEPVSEGEPREVKVYGIGSTDQAREELKKAKIEQLETGMIFGVSGVLLNEGRWSNFDVITLLAEAREDIPDALAAAKILEAFDKLLPEIKIDTTPLFEQAEKFEEHLKGLRRQVEPPMATPFKGMYG